MRERKSLAERAYTGRRKVGDARSFRAPRPTEIECPLQKRRTHCAGQMMSARAPIETRSTQRPARVRQAVNIDAEIAPEYVAALR